MTRSEYQSTDPDDFKFIVTTALVGYLGIITADGYPRVVPLNFVADGETVYFHSGNHGEMFEALKVKPKVSFSIDIPYSVIPSYWISKISAAAATMFYKSILIKGRAVPVADIDEKVHGLRLITEKYQPEGGYRPIKPEETAYHPILKNTMVYRIDPDHIELRVKFNQKKSSDYKKKIIRKLEERRQGPDLATAAILKKMLD